MKKVRVLVAYPYLTKALIALLNANKDRLDVYIDSGAFTAWKAGKEVELNKYIETIKTLEFKPERYFTLDKIGDPVETINNYQTMLDAGLTPIPIFTRGEDIAVLERFYQTSDLVGIGGLVATRRNKGFVKGIMSVVGERKVHWLGFTNQAFVSVFKPYSCDSSSAWSSTRFATVPLYLGGGRSIKVNKETFKKRPSPQIEDILRKIQIEPRHLISDSAWVNHGKITDPHVKMACYSFLLWMRDLEREFGTRYFIACTATWEIQCLLEMNTILESLGVA